MKGGKDERRKGDKEERRNGGKDEREEERERKEGNVYNYQNMAITLYTRSSFLLGFPP